jgi:hypothetical protein
MNVAFSALLIFILVLPGIILRYTYARGAWRWASPTSTTALADEIAYSVTFAIGLHLLWSFLAALVSQLEVDAHSILVLLTGSYGPDDKFFEPAVASVAKYPVAITAYLLTLYGFATGLGYGTHYLVRKYKLDRKTRLLRFKNEWYCLLSGEVLEFKEFEEAQQASGAPPINVEEDIDGVYLTAIVDLATETYLYRGVVADFGSIEPAIWTEYCWSWRIDGSSPLTKKCLWRRRRKSLNTRRGRRRNNKRSPKTQDTTL